MTRPGSPPFASGVDPARLGRALEAVVCQLEAERGGTDHWEGRLSSSALSTATAVVALALAERPDPGRYQDRIRSGLRWLATYVNADGGWGDTVCSRSNLSTTALVWAAFGAVSGADTEHRAVVDGVERWLTARAGGLAPEQLAPAVIRRYGKDRTFSVPILTLCALSGRLGSGPDAWRWVIPLPFELAACPARWFAALKLPVVSYALPALIAIGQARFHHLPPANPLARLIRNAARARTLRVLESIQPPNGGFLEATPLTSFVTMSLIGSGERGSVVVERGLKFLTESQRPDGSWPIDTNLATWLTTWSINSLPAPRLRAVDRSGARAWLLGQQYQRVHPYTQAAPGGWAWTDLPGGVPDADDTAGALLALARLPGSGGEADQPTLNAVDRGIGWLLDLQNRDGGIPTFCRGWGNLPFDRSSTDITAHAMRAWMTWRPKLGATRQQQIDAALQRAWGYLQSQQRPDGSWVPLWFGNEAEGQEENPAYGTSRVLSALCELSGVRWAAVPPRVTLGLRWLLGCQTTEGGFGGAPGLPASVEETALVVEVLGKCLSNGVAGHNEWPVELPTAWARGVNWLLSRVETGEWRQPSPIGFYFAKLWYYERLYPQIFTVAALGAASEVLCGGNPAGFGADASRAEHRAQ